VPIDPNERLRPPVGQMHASRLPDMPVTCPYCGCMLNPILYFCPACATPCQHPNAVLPVARPLELTDEELVYRKAPQAVTLFWVYAGVIVFVGLLTHALFQEEDAWLALVFQSSALLITTCVFAAQHWRSLRVQFARIGFQRWEALVGVLALLPVLGINYVYHGLLRRDVEMSGESIRDLGVGEPALILFICIFPAVLEEIAFRGLLQHWLQVAIKPWKAMMVASVMFALLHFSFISFPYLVLAGMLMGWTKWKTGSLYPSMLIHFLHNLIVLEFFGL